jgi:hypothetical protein
LNLTRHPPEEGLVTAVLLIRIPNTGKKVTNTVPKAQNSKNQGFSNYFCLTMEGSGSVLVTNGSEYGSERPQKNICKIRIRMRILNTA